MTGHLPRLSRRNVVVAAIAGAMSATVSVPSAEGASKDRLTERSTTTRTVTTKDGVDIFYKDWGPKTGQPIFFHHGWPLSSDDWDAQMLAFVGRGYRVIAHDRRGHGRSTQVSEGYDMYHYAADVAAVVGHLDLRNVVHVGHSTGGGEATRYVARHGNGRVAHRRLGSALGEAREARHAQDL